MSNPKKSTSKTPAVVEKEKAAMTETSLELRSYTFRSYSDEEKKKFKKVLHGFEEAVEPVLRKLSEEPDLLPGKTFDYQDALQHLEEATKLKAVEEWLFEKYNQIFETRRAHLSATKETVDKIVRRARTLSEDHEDVAYIFANLFDFLAAPAKKTSATKKKKKTKPA